MTAVSFFIQIAYVIIFTIFIILFVCYGTFRTVKYTSHYARGLAPVSARGGIDTNKQNPYALMLHLNFKGNFIRYIKYENIHIKLSIDGYFGQNVRHVKVKNPLNSYGILKENGQLLIRTVEPIHLIGFNSEFKRIEEINYYVELPIASLEFNSNPTPEAIGLKGNHGVCLADAVPKARGDGPSRKRDEPPRYIEVLPSSPPIDEHIF